MKNCEKLTAIVYGMISLYCLLLLICIFPLSFSCLLHLVVVVVVVVVVVMCVCASLLFSFHACQSVSLRSLRVLACLSVSYSTHSGI